MWVLLHVYLCFWLCVCQRERERERMSMDKFLPFIGMVVAIMAQTGSMILNKAAMSKGTNEYIIVVYANALSALILLPYILTFHRLHIIPLFLSFIYLFYSVVNKVWHYCLFFSCYFEFLVYMQIRAPSPYPLHTLQNLHACPVWVRKKQLHSFRDLFFCSLVLIDAHILEKDRGHLNLFYLLHADVHLRYLEISA